MNTRTRIADARIYINGTELVGVAKELIAPPFAPILEGRIVWSSFTDAMNMLTNPLYPTVITARYSAWAYTSGGVRIEKPGIVIIQAWWKDLPVQYQYRQVPHESRYTAHYFKHEIGGEVVMEFDTQNAIYTLDGVDLLGGISDFL